MIINNIGINFAGGGGEPCTGGTCNLQGKSYTFADRGISAVTITPDSGKDGLSAVTVSVNRETRDVRKLIDSPQAVSTNYRPASGYSGLELLTVNTIPITTAVSYTITENGDTTINIPEGVVGITGGTISVNVPTPASQSKVVTITSNTETEIVPDQGYVLSGVTVTTEIPPQPYSGYTINDYMKGTVTALTQSDFSDMTELRSSVFNFYYNLVTADIPSTITKIGQKAFSSAGLHSITINGPIEIEIEALAYNYFGSNLIGLENVIYKINQSAFRSSNIEGELRFGQLVNAIGYSSFIGNTGITSLAFGGTIGEIENTSVYNNPFKDCNSLSAIDFTYNTCVPTINASVQMFNQAVRLNIPEYLYNKWSASSGWSGQSNITYVSVPSPSGYAESQIVYVIDSAGTQASGFVHGKASDWQSDVFDSESRTVTVTVYGPGVYWIVTNAYAGNSFAEKCNGISEYTCMYDSSRTIDEITFPTNFKGFKIAEGKTAFYSQPKNITFKSSTPPTIYGSLNVQYTDTSRCDKMYVPAEALSAYQASTSITDTWLSAYTLTPLYATADVTYNIADNSSPVKVYDNYSGDLEYTVDSDPTVYSSTTYTFDSTGDHTLHFKLASTYRAKTPNRLFSGITEVTSAVLSDGVYETGANTFRGTSISALTANGLEIIGTSTFESCPTVTWSMIPTSVTTINQKAFNNSGLSGAITIPARITSIGSSAFTSTAIESVVFEDRSDLLDLSSTNYLFSNCTSLSSTTINSNINIFASNCFNGCTNLSVVSWTGVSTSIGHEIDDRSVRGYEFQNCKSLVSITLPEGVEKLGNACFGGCTGLTSIVLPASIGTNSAYGKHIHNNSFSGCTSLTSITCYSETEPLAVAESFANMSSTGTLYTPENADYSNWLTYLGSGWTQATIPA